jgi:hypothetical protein
VDAVPSSIVRAWPVCPGCGRDLTDVSPMWTCPECATTPDSASVKDGMLKGDRPCLQCGYNLKGLEISGRCPECGGEVLRSLQGNLLIYSASAFVSKLVLGSTLVLWGLVLFCISLIGSFLAGASRVPANPAWLSVFPVAMKVIPLVGSVCSLSGWWFLSAPDPALMGQDRMTSARKVLRITVILSAAAFAAATFSQMQTGGVSLTSVFRRGPANLSFIMTAGNAAVLINALVWPVKTFASLQYVHAIALRAQSVPQARRARILIWFAIIGAIVGPLAIGTFIGLGNIGIAAPDLLLAPPMCGGAVGILAWSCTYAALIGGLRMDLSRISRRLAERDVRSGATSARFDATT